MEDHPTQPATPTTQRDVKKVCPPAPRPDKVKAAKMTADYNPTSKRRLVMKD